MKISIITPSFNQGAYIRRCLESIQTAPGLAVEHIVLDNCSTDGTGDILREFEARNDGVERVFLIKPDKGQTGAINEGFRRATGDVVCWLNTDEFYMPGALESVARHFEQHAEVDVFFGDCDFYDASGKLVKNRIGFPFIFGMLLYYGCYISSCATFIHRRVLDRGEYLDESYRVAMDFEWYMRMADKGFRFERIAQTLAGFVWTGTNISMTQRDRSRIENFQIRSRYSNIPGPAPFRAFAYRALTRYWMAYRVLRRRFS